MSRSRILFVDDNVLGHWSVSESLTEAGFAVTGLCRGMEALAMLRDGDDFDLLLTEFQLPDGISGFELAAEWRCLQPGRPVAYTSRFPEMAIGALRRDEGFIAKPAEIGDLLRVVGLLIAEARMPLLMPMFRRALYVH